MKYVSLLLRTGGRLLPKHLTGAIMILLLIFTITFLVLNNATFT